MQDRSAAMLAVGNLEAGRRNLKLAVAGKSDTLWAIGILAVGVSEAISGCRTRYSGFGIIERLSPDDQVPTRSPNTFLVREPRDKTSWIDKPGSPAVGSHVSMAGDSALPRKGGFTRAQIQYVQVSEELIGRKVTPRSRPLGKQGIWG